MKQKMVIKVELKCKKCRTKALKVAAAVEGVVSVEMQGKERDELVLVGDGVDPVCLTKSLRRQVGHANIVKVEEAK